MRCRRSDHGHQKLSHARLSRAADGPAQVALFDYNNAHSSRKIFRHSGGRENIRVGKFHQNENLVTGETLEGKLPPPHGWNWRNENVEDRVSFTVHLPRTATRCLDEK